jgi:hypothetical protein
MSVGQNSSGRAEDQLDALPPWQPSCVCYSTCQAAPFPLTVSLSYPLTHRTSESLSTELWSGFVRGHRNGHRDVGDDLSP